MKKNILFLILVFSCATTQEKIEKVKTEDIVLKPIESKKDKVLKINFPTNIITNSCEKYLENLKKDDTYDILTKILNKRPHKFYSETVYSELIRIPIEYIPREKIYNETQHPLIHKDVYDSLISMLEAARIAGHRITIQSAFRTINEQNYLWHEELKKYNHDYEKAAYRVAPPCFSEHATGKTIDLALDSINEEISKDPAYDWLKKNSLKFGWEESFSEDKIYTTKNPNEEGIMVEPWHFRHISVSSK